MSGVVTAAKLILGNLELFSRLVIRTPLHAYQLEPCREIIASVFGRHGHEFLIIMPRQSGKNEAIAQMLVYLLNVFQRKGGNIVYGATGDGIGRGKDRLEQRLDNDWNSGRWEKKAGPARRILNRAQVTFLSTHPTAATRGETASLLMVIDEMQDQDASHLAAVFTPMRAATNATAVYIGTVKTTADALWLKRQELEAAEDRDGRRYVWVVDPDEVTEANPDYATFLAKRIAESGRHHPIVAAEYFNEPLEGKGGLFDERRRRLMLGEHGRQHRPTEDAIYIATLDVAGQDEGATDAVAQLDNPGRDYTVAHVFELTISPGDPGPTYAAVDIFVDHGSRHFQDVPGRPKLVERLAAWLRHWNIAHLIADSGGVGQGISDWLQANLPAAVTPVQFNARNKAELGTAFLSVIETGRFRYFDDGRSEGSDTWWFLEQAAGCSYYIPPDGQMDRDLRWQVPATRKIKTAAGPKPLHDDRLFSAALVAAYDELHKSGRLKAGQAKSRIIQPTDPLKHMEF